MLQESRLGRGCHHDRHKSSTHVLIMSRYVMVFWIAWLAVTLSLGAEL
jgi:hypothetical protein